MNRQLTDRDLIAETAEDVRFEAYPDWTIDTLLCHPDDAKNLAHAVRVKLARPNLKDHEILGTLVNARKQSRLRTRSRRKTKSAHSRSGATAGPPRTKGTR